MTFFQRLKIIAVILAVAVATFTPVAYLILKYQKDKKIAKGQSDKAYYMQMEADSEKYRNDYLKNIEATIQDNKRKMDEARLTYDYLLKQQASIIAQHSKQIANTTAVPAQYVSQTSSAPKTTTKTATVSKPKSSAPSSTS